MTSSNYQDQSDKPQNQNCQYKTGKTLGSGSYSVVKECVHIDTGRYYAAKIINKRLMAGREHLVCLSVCTKNPHTSDLSHFFDSIAQKTNHDTRFEMKLQFLSVYLWVTRIF